MPKADTPFSFHCMICFEEFHPDHRYPVVLPCGHTYVCNTCADRLDKCMECRTPLYEELPRDEYTTTLAQQHQQQPYVVSTPATLRASWSGARAAGPVRTTQQPQPKKAAVQRRRLPLPKNLVLLSLIAATELASAETRRHYDTTTTTADTADVDMLLDTKEPAARTTATTSTEPVDIHMMKGEEVTGSGSGGGGGGGVPNLHSIGSMLDVESDEDDDDDDDHYNNRHNNHHHAYDHHELHKLTEDDEDVVDEDDNEEEKIKISTSIAVGSAGTYAVAAKDGLELCTTLPTTTTATSTYNNDQNSSNNDSDDVQTLVSGYRKESSKDEEDPSVSPHSPVILKYGDRVQVVSVHGGWAKLGRGYGFVRTDRNQLVKGT